MKQASKPLVAAMNDDLVWVMEDGSSFTDAVDFVKDGFKLRLFRELGNAQLYVLTEEMETVYVTLWTDAIGRASVEGGEGGIGFSDQLDIWEAMMRNEEIDMMVAAHMAQLDRNFELDGIFDGQKRRCRCYSGTYMSFVSGDPLSVTRCTEDEMKAALRAVIEKEYGYAG